MYFNSIHTLKTLHNDDILSCARTMLTLEQSLLCLSKLTLEMHYHSFKFYMHFNSAHSWNDFPQWSYIKLWKDNVHTWTSITTFVKEPCSRLKCISTVFILEIQFPQWSPIKLWKDSVHTWTSINMFVKEHCSHLRGIFTKLALEIHFPQWLHIKFGKGNVHTWISMTIFVKELCWYFKCTSEVFTLEIQFQEWAVS